VSQSNSRNNFAKLYDLGEKKRLEKENASTPVTPVTDVTPVTPVTPVQRVKEDAAPKRDFTRVPNSVVRDAIPAGMFTGKGKQLYDYLYSQTRGAIVPSKSARIPTEKVMKGAGMTRHTYRTHLERLMRSGLIQVEERPGEHGGNFFTVYTPDEVGVERGHRGDRGDRGDPCQNLPGVQGSEVDRGDRGLSAEDTTTSGVSKTLIKTNTEIDDEGFAGFIGLIRETAKEITGRELSNLEQERWRELAELLMTELRIAAARTTVSSVPAFLTEHLRRRLWKMDKKQMSVEAKPTNSGERPSMPGEQAKECPDCGGTGFYYPKGFEGGVARCKHERLEGGK
jgi:hypothetical protein